MENITDEQLLNYLKGKCYITGSPIYLHSEQFCKISDSVPTPILCSTNGSEIDDERIYYVNVPLSWVTNEPNGIITCEFIRGMIEDDIDIDHKNGNLQIKSKILSKKKEIVLEHWLAKQKIQFDKIDGYIYSLTCWNASDLLSKLYDHSTSQTRNPKIYRQYLDVILKTNKTPPQIKVVLNDPEAKMPFKSRSTDEGFDLTLISKYL